MLRTLCFLRNGNSITWPIRANHRYLADGMCFHRRTLSACSINAGIYPLHLPLCNGNHQGLIGEHWFLVNNTANNNFGSRLGQRRRRRSNIEPTMSVDFVSSVFVDIIIIAVIKDNKKKHRLISCNLEQIPLLDRALIIKCHRMSASARFTKKRNN